MSILSDQKHLLTHQYKDARNLDARFQLHERYSTNKHGWHRWVFDQVSIPLGGKVLELGCGPALLWTKNGDRIPADWGVTLSDFSPGMLEEAKQNLGQASGGYSFEVIDAQSIPYEDESLDGVIANHMLYHVPDRKKAYSEIRRVLKAGGFLYAATNGKDHHQELSELVRKVKPDAYADLGAGSDWFSLETGGDELSEWFSEVRVQAYDDSLHVPAAEPLIAYVESGERLTKAELAELRTIVEREIDEKGAIHIRKQPVLFIAEKSRTAA